MDYYEKKRMSATTFNKFIKCPESAFNEETVVTEAMQIGSKVDDALLLGNYEPILTAKQQKPAASNKIIDTMVARAKESNLFMSYLEGEHQKEYEFEIDGVPWKAKLDILQKDKVVDLKTIKDFKEVYDIKTGTYVPAYEIRGYDIQLALYAYVSKRKDAYLALISKDMDLRIVQIPDYILTNALGVIMERNKEVWGYYNGKNLWRCGECSYCKKTRKENEIKKEWSNGT